MHDLSFDDSCELFHARKVLFYLHKQRTNHKEKYKIYPLKLIERSIAVFILEQMVSISFSL